ncbi:hypothetical protein BDZ94DRAFT_1311842 [Collybia nuda]|uniref:F-box domain-containing protein n=1 Tax=Collybia nuda TaxID=64659 RepID=A0A9P5XYE4_9AGAR|nr:hypothetical protein BDZ94DRAFT_1311842 [Collybia nuda]
MKGNDLAPLFLHKAFIYRFKSLTHQIRPQFQPPKKSGMLKLITPEFVPAHAPILTIPPEIIAEILTLLSPFPLPISIPPNILDPFWAATQACTQWRHMALTSPRLWSSLSIEFPQCVDDCTFQKTIQAATECLRRSHPVPLLVTLALQALPRNQYKHKYYYTEDSTPLSSLSFLAPHAPRIESLSLKTLSDLSSRELAFTFPNLHHLDVDVPDYQYRMHLTTFITRSGDAITYLNIRYPLTSGDWCKILTRTRHLTELLTPNPLPCAVVRTMAVCAICPNLQTLRCSLYKEASDEFLEMLETRQGVMRHVTVECMKFGFEEEQRRRVSTIREKGMNVEVLEPPAWCMYN